MLQTGVKALCKHGSDFCGYILLNLKGVTLVAETVDFSCGPEAWKGFSKPIFKTTG